MIASVSCAAVGESSAGDRVRVGAGEDGCGDADFLRSDERDAELVPVDERDAELFPVDERGAGTGAAELAEDVGCRLVDGARGVDVVVDVPGG